MNWIVDNIPATTSHYLENGAVVYEKGFPLGFVGTRTMLSTYAKPGIQYLNNHVVIKLSYHQQEDDTGAVRIVGFEVDPYSVHHEPSPTNKHHLLTCQSNQHLERTLRAQAVAGSEVIMGGADATIYWTYDVVWLKSDVKWASRWDAYLKMTNSEIHWFSIVNSLVIVMFLSAFVAVIMVRTLRKDLANYDQIAANPDDAMEETGWKNIHGDVFRPPNYGAFFSVLVGSGVQLLGCVMITLVFAVLGFLSPANRGGLMTAVLMLFAFMGAFAGYWSTRMYTMFKLTSWKTNTLWTALFFPGFVFFLFFVMNCLIWGEKSSGAVPFATLIALLVLWFGISVPLVYLGAHIAVRKEPMKPPVKVNPLPRTIQPSGDWFSNSDLSMIIGGVLPFAAAFIEIFFIMSSVWLHQFYYVFGFLFLVFLILVVTCAEISIVMCYFHLCQENYHWWWRSFFTSGSSALYLFLYSAFYYATKLEIEGLIPTLLFFGYMLLACAAFFLLTGTIGFASTYAFVHVIYASVKID